MFFAAGKPEQAAKLAGLARDRVGQQLDLIDKDRFDAEPWPRLQGWLERFLASDLFESVMHKYPKWVPGDPPTPFPDATG